MWRPGTGHDQWKLYLADWSIELFFILYQNPFTSADRRCTLERISRSAKLRESNSLTDTFMLNSFVYFLTWEDTLLAHTSSPILAAAEYGGQLVSDLWYTSGREEGVCVVGWPIVIIERTAYIIWFLNILCTCRSASQPTRHSKPWPDPTRGCQVQLVAPGDPLAASVLFWIRSCQINVSQCLADIWSIILTSTDLLIRNFNVVNLTLLTQGRVHWNIILLLYTHLTSQVKIFLPLMVTGKFWKSIHGHFVRVWFVLFLLVNMKLGLLWLGYEVTWQLQH